MLKVNEYLFVSAILFIHYQSLTELGNHSFFVPVSLTSQAMYSNLFDQAYNT